MIVFVWLDTELDTRLIAYVNGISDFDFEVIHSRFSLLFVGQFLDNETFESKFDCCTPIFFERHSQFY